MSDKDSSNDVLVKFSDVTKQYGDLVVLDKLNLEIKKMKWFQLLDHLDQEKQLCLEY